MKKCPIVEIKNADVKRGNEEVLHNIDFVLERGQHTAIIGPNGAGKTTLMHLMTAEAEDENTVRSVKKDDSYVKLFGEENFSIWDIRARTGLVTNAFQHKYKTMAGHTKGLEVVCSGAEGKLGYTDRNTVPKKLLEKSRELIGSLGISDLEDKPIGAMSSGEGRKIVIARALINDPEIFALDEPTTGLDPQAQADFVQFMEEVAKERASTLVLVTHHANEIISAIKRVVGVRYGKILFDGDKKEFLNSKNISDLFGAPFSVLENQQGYYQFVSGEKHHWKLT